MFDTKYKKIYVCENCENEWTQEQEDEKDDTMLLNCADCLSLKVKIKNI